MLAFKSRASNKVSPPPRLNLATCFQSRANHTLGATASASIPLRGGPHGGTWVPPPETRPQRAPVGAAQLAVVTFLLHGANKRPCKLYGARVCAVRSQRTLFGTWQPPVPAPLKGRQELPVYVSAEAGRRREGSLSAQHSTGCTQLLPITGLFLLVKRGNTATI